MNVNEITELKCSLTKVAWFVGIWVLGFCWVLGFGHLGFSPLSLAADENDTHPATSEPAAPAAGDAATSQPLTPNQIATIFDLIARLESNDDEIRLEAEAELLELGPKTLPFLDVAFKKSGKRIYLYLFTKISEEEKLASTSGERGECTSPSATAESEGASEHPDHPAQPCQGETASPADENRVIEKYFKMKFDSALALFESGQYDECLALIDALLLIEPGISIRSDLVRLRLACKDRIVGERFLRLVLVPDARYYRCGQNATLNLEIANISKEVITIDRKTEPSSGGTTSPARPPGVARSEEGLPTGMLSISISEYDCLGSSISETCEAAVEIPEHLVLAPGESYKTSIPFDTSFGLPDRGTYRAFRLTLRSTFMRVAARDRVFYRSLHFPQAVIKVLPGNLESVLETNPLQSLMDALRNGNMKNLFHASLIMPEDKTTQAVDVLIQALGESSPEVKRVIMVCLCHITGRNLGVSEAKWIDWWSQQRRNARTEERKK